MARTECHNAAIPLPPGARARRDALLASLAVRGGGLFVLAGAITKTLWGTPADLPVVILESGLDSEALFFLALALEWMVGMTAMLSPRIGWIPLCATLLTFIGVSTAQAAAGDSKCGCFGGLLTMPPAQMLIIDICVLGLILLTRPWIALRICPRLLWPIPASAALAAIALGYVLLGQHVATLEALAPHDSGPAVPPVSTDSNIAANPVLGDGGHSAGQDAMATNADAAARHAGESDAEPAAAGPAPTAQRSAAAWKLPERFPRYVVLRPPSWEGKHLAHTELATWADVSAFPRDATLVFYYDTCTLCAAHLEKLAEQRDRPELVLIQLPSTPSAAHPVVVKALPPGLHVELPRGPKWQIRTPWDVIVERGIVVRTIAGF